MLSISLSGSFDKTIKALTTMKSGEPFKNLESHGRRGVDALSRATPIDTGETADSWGFQTNYKGQRYSLSWFNTHEVNGVNVAVALQYGHATRHGGWVEGVDYINPAIQPVINQAVDEAWKKVRDA